MNTESVPAPAGAKRRITTHEVNGVNNGIGVFVMDEPGAGGAHHVYNCSWESGFETIMFQNGPIKENGVNGLTHEVLLSIVKDRLESFQRGPYKCDENGLALGAVDVAIAALKMRTSARLKRGVEGTMAK